MEIDKNLLVGFGLGSLVGVVAAAFLRKSPEKPKDIAKGRQPRAHEAKHEERSSVEPEQITDWENLGFRYRPTNCHVKYTWRDGEWDDGVMVQQPFVKVGIMSNILHYGQNIFEGLKTFRTKDGRAMVFKSEASCQRMANGCKRVCIPEIPRELFQTAIDRVIKENAEYIPPYGSGGALYIRPTVFGSGSALNLGPSSEYTFIVMVNPVGDYYKGGISPVKALVVEDFDRAAPKGVGCVKYGGNYGADTLPAKLAKEAGFPIALYLDAVEHNYVEEFSTSNFIAIDKDGKLVTPKSSSVLPSITNTVIQQCAIDLGIEVERRQISWDEVSSFQEVAACGTAVVLIPIESITRGDEVVQFGGFSTFQKLYDRVRAVQQGEIKVNHGWDRFLDC